MAANIWCGRREGHTQKNSLYKQNNENAPAGVESLSDDGWIVLFAEGSPLGTIVGLQWDHSGTRVDLEWTVVGLEWD